MMTTTTVTTPASSSLKSLDAGQPAPSVDAQGGAADAAQAGAPALPFAAWLSGQTPAVALAVDAVLPADAAAADDDAPAAAAVAAGDGAEQDPAPSAPTPDGALLAAMAMPLMPLSPAQLVQAMPAAQPAGAAPDHADAGPAAPAAGARPPERNAARPEAVAVPGIALTRAADAALPAAAQPDAASAPAPQRAAQAQLDAGGSPERGDANGTGSANPQAGAANNAGGNAAIGAAGMAQPPANAPAPDTVRLAGPPTAWRQSLQEALGERLQLQVGNGIEQAVIRLEPPQLGRIEIAIRHSAGSLEVNISATHGEVLRQLQTVGEHLRSDLSQRQFSEVAVTVAPAQKGGAAPFGDPQQGRGRQPDREQEDRQPGRGLAEAGTSGTGFALGNRDQA